MKSKRKLNKRQRWEKKRQPAKKTEKEIEFERLAKVVEIGPRAPATQGGHESMNGFRTPARRFSERCSTCNGLGYIHDLKGLVIDCPRCHEPCE